MQLSVGELARGPVSPHASGVLLGKGGLDLSCEGPSSPTMSQLPQLVPQQGVRKAGGASRGEVERAQGFNSWARHQCRQVELPNICRRGSSVHGPCLLQELVLLEHRDWSDEIQGAPR